LALYIGLITKEDGDFDCALPMVYAFTDTGSVLNRPDYGINFEVMEARLFIEHGLNTVYYLLAAPTLTVFPFPYFHPSFAQSFVGNVHSRR
jgi:hypothetical protein